MLHYQEIEQLAHEYRKIRLATADQQRLLQSISQGQPEHSTCLQWLTHAIDAATEKNLKGLIVHRERCAYFIHQSVALATLLNPRIGYAKATEIAKASEQSGRPVREIVAEQGLMTASEFDALVLQAAQGRAPE